MIKLETNLRMSKDRIFSIVCEAKAEGKVIDLDLLINYFAPPVPKKPKTKEQWVALAVAKKDVRKYLNYLHVRDKKLWATDGSRMHWCDTDLADGFYCPKTLFLVDLAYKYPDTYRVIPKKFETDTATLTKDDWTIELDNKVRRTRINKHPKYKFQECLLLDALSAGDIKYRITDCGKMKGESVHGEFVVMGLGLVKKVLRSPK